MIIKKKIICPAIMPRVIQFARKLTVAVGAMRAGII